MPTLTIRNVPAPIVDSIKRMARENGRSMEQEVRAALEERFRDRLAVLRELEKAWTRQKRRPTAAEIEAWIREGRG